MIQVTPQTTTVTNTKIPELYPENLKTLQHLLDLVPQLASVNGVFEIELRVRIDDVEAWAVLGYGESGDPCVLRFESNPKPPVSSVRGVVTPYTTTINALKPDDRKCDAEPI